MRCVALSTLAERISIHVPREGDDATMRFCGVDTYYFYPRPPRGGRPQDQPHRGEGGRFLSTSPARGTTRLQTDLADAGSISIHVPREGDDV